MTYLKHLVVEVELLVILLTAMLVISSFIILAVELLAA